MIMKYQGFGKLYPNGQTFLRYHANQRLTRQDIRSAKQTLASVNWCRLLCVAKFAHVIPVSKDEIKAMFYVI